MSQPQPTVSVPTAAPAAPAAEAAPAEGRLPRRLGTWSAAAVVVGMIIGSGIFRVPATAAAEVGAVGAMLALWVLGGAIASSGSLAVAELAAMFPRAGGIFVYLRETYGPLPAFLFGWTDFLIVRPGTSAAVALIFTAYLGHFVPLAPGTQRVIGAALIVLFSAANYRSVRGAALVQNASSAAKLVALLGLALAILLFGRPQEGAFAGPISFAPATWGGFGVALIAVMWAYDGWADVASLTGEVRDPGRALPRGIMLGMAGVIAAYLAANVAYLWVLPARAMAGSELVAADAATRALGDVGGALISALVMLSTVGTLNANVMTGPRFVWAMADEDLFFRRLAAVHPRFRTPHVAIAVSCLLALVYISSQTFEQLTNAIVLGEWPFYALAVAAVAILRRRLPDHPRPYRSPASPWLPAAFVAGSLALLLNSLVETPALTLVSFAVILSGLPVYAVWRSRAAP
ncbi:MAG TPA: amino acid permease [Longimicrobiales bacterium]|nr:amino acid permease [Longimicrobiales bacterium]